MRPQIPTKKLLVQWTSISVLTLIGGCAQLGSYFPSLMNYGGTNDLQAAQEQVRCIRPNAVPNTPINTSPACIELQSALAEYKASNATVAEQKFKNSIDLYTNNGGGYALEDLRMAWFGLAAVYDLQARYADADKTYNFIKASFGDSVRYYHNYGYSLYLRKDKIGARTQWLTGLNLFPSSKTLLSDLETVSEIQEGDSTNPDAAGINSNGPLASPTLQ